MIHISDDLSTDHLVHHLPLWEVVQDLHSETDPTPKTCARLCRLLRLPPGSMSCILHTDQYYNLPSKIYLDHEVGIICR